MRIAEDITKLTGNTPLVRLRRVTDGAGAEVVAKLEFFNPAGSVKDRIGVAMIDAAEQTGCRPGHHRRGADQRQHRHRAGHGVRRPRLPLHPHHAGDDEPGARAAARGSAPSWCSPRARRHGRRHRQGRGNRQGRPAVLHAAAVREPGQPGDPPPHHRRGDLADTDGAVDIFVAGVGTGGTITGVGEVLKERKPSVRMVAVEPAARRCCPAARRAAPDPGHRRRVRPRRPRHRRDRRDLAVENEDAFDMARRLAHEEGLLVGISSRGGRLGRGAGGAPAGERRQADRGRGSRLRRALPEHRAVRGPRRLAVLSAPARGRAGRPGSVTRRRGAPRSGAVLPRCARDVGAPGQPLAVGARRTAGGPGLLRS